MAIEGEGALFTLARFKGSPEEVEAQWLEARRAGVGGSDVAAIMGLSRYGSAYQVYQDKVLGIHEDISDRPAVHWGNVLEPVVGAEYAANHPGRTIRRVNGIATSIARPWAQASLDYEVRDPEAGWGVLEIKTAGLRRAHDWEDGVPVYYQTQVAHYLSVTGRSFADVSVLIGGSDYREYRLERDDEDVAAVDEAVDRFWHGNVEAGVPPEVGPADVGATFASHDRPGADMLEAAEVPLEVTRYRMAKAALEDARRDCDAWAARVRELIGDAAGIDCPGVRVRWLRGERGRFDRKAFDADHPGTYEKYVTKAPADMGLRITEKKE